MEAIDPKEFADWLSDDFSEATQWLRDRIAAMEGDREYIAMRAIFLLVLVALAMREMLATGDEEFIAQHLALLSIKTDERTDELIEYWTRHSLITQDD